MHADNNNTTSQSKEPQLLLQPVAGIGSISIQVKYTILVISLVAPSRHQHFFACRWLLIVVSFSFSVLYYCSCSYHYTQQLQQLQIVCSLLLQRTHYLQLRLCFDLMLLLCFSYALILHHTNQIAFPEPRVKSTLTLSLSQPSNGNHEVHESRVIVYNLQVSCYEPMVRLLRQGVRDRYGSGFLCFVSQNQNLKKEV